MNVRQIFHWVAWVCLALAVSVVQLSVIHELPLPFAFIDIPLIVACFIVLVFDMADGFWWGVIVGIFLEVYSPLPWGTLVVPLLGTLLIVNLLLNTFLTNRSLASLVALGLVGGAVSILLRWLLVSGLYWLSLTTDRGDWGLQVVVWRSVWTAIWLAIAFGSLRLVSRRLQSSFLVSGRR